MMKKRITRTQVLLPQAVMDKGEMMARHDHARLIDDHFEQFHDTHGTAIAAGGFHTQYHKDERSEGSMESAVINHVYEDGVCKGIIFADASGYRQSDDKNHKRQLAKEGFENCKTFVNESRRYPLTSGNISEFFLSYHAEPKAQFKSSLATASIQSWIDERGNSHCHGLFSNIGHHVLLVIDPKTKTLRHCLPARYFPDENKKNWDPAALQDLNKLNLHHLQIKNIDLQPDWIILSMSPGAFVGFDCESEMFGVTEKGEIQNIKQATGEKNYVDIFKTIKPNEARFNAFLQTVFEKETDDLPISADEITKAFLPKIVPPVSAKLKKIDKLMSALIPHIYVFKNSKNTPLTSIQDWIENLKIEGEQLENIFKRLFEKLNHPSEICNMDTDYSTFISMIENQANYYKKQIEYLYANATDLKDLTNLKVKYDNFSSILDELMIFRKHYHIFYGKSQRRNLEAQYPIQMWLQDYKDHAKQTAEMLTAYLYEPEHHHIDPKIVSADVFINKHLENRPLGEDTMLSVIRVPDPEVELVRAWVESPEIRENLKTNISQLPPSRFEFIYNRLLNEKRFVRDNIFPDEEVGSLFRDTVYYGSRKELYKNVSIYSAKDLDYPIKLAFLASIEATLLNKPSQSLDQLYNQFQALTSGQHQFFDRRREPALDRLLRVRVSNSWQKSWKQIRQYALEKLFAEVEGKDSEVKKHLLQEALNQDFLFKSHRSRFFFKAFGKTATQKKIEAKLKLV